MSKRKEEVDIDKINNIDEMKEYLKVLMKKQEEIKENLKKITKIPSEYKINYGYPMEAIETDLTNILLKLNEYKVSIEKNKNGTIDLMDILIEKEKVSGDLADILIKIINDLKEYTNYFTRHLNSFNGYKKRKLSNIL